MNFLSYFGTFFLGICSGSFLNSVIYRLETNQGFPLYRSFCPKCKHYLSASDLIPILSFILLRGRCRYCSEKISWQYPLVEFGTGILFLLIYISHIVSSIYDFLLIVYLFVISSFLVIVFVYDLKHYLIPDVVVYAGIFFVLVWNFFESLRFYLINLEELAEPIWIIIPLFNLVLSALIPAFLFWLIVFFSKEKWLGKGDIGLVFLIGLILGWPKILAALFLSFVLGAIMGVGLIVFKKKTLKSEIPFGPFLITGTFLAFFWGEKLISFYWNLL